MKEKLSTFFRFFVFLFWFIRFELWFQGKTVIAEIENVIGVIEGEQEPDR